MIDLYGLKLADLLPDSIKGDKDIMAIAEALDVEMQAITKSIMEVIMLPRIDEMTEDVVDHLAGQLHVDYYEPLGLNLDKKRALVKNSLSWHRRKGTKSVIEEIIKILFATDFDISEWYEYGGDPYYFRIKIRDMSMSAERLNDLIRAVYELKNVRSWLEGVRFERELENHIHIGQVGRHRTRFVIDGTANTIRIDPAAVCYGSVSRQTSHFKISGRATEIHIGDGRIYSGITGRSKSKTVIKSSEEVNS